jgi:hypothetical protein
MVNSSDGAIFKIAPRPQPWNGGVVLLIYLVSQPAVKPLGLAMCARAESHPSRKWRIQTSQKIVRFR